MSASVKDFITWLDMDTLIQIRILTSSDDVVVFGKPAKVARAQPPLRNECDCEVGENRRVDPDTKPSDEIAVKDVSLAVDLSFSVKPRTYTMTVVYR